MPSDFAVLFVASGIAGGLFLMGMIGAKDFEALDERGPVILIVSALCWPVALAVALKALLRGLANRNRRD